MFIENLRQMSAEKEEEKVNADDEENYNIPGINLTTQQITTLTKSEAVTTDVKQISEAEAQALAGDSLNSGD